MPRDFRYKRQEDFLRDARGVEPRYVTTEGTKIRAFFASRWWLCVYIVEAKTEKEAQEFEEKFVKEGFTPISIEESPIRLF